MGAVGDDKRPLRKDAARNRERLIQAADELVAERGLDIALDEIARQAGMGVGTVYRHFDCKGDVLQALFDRRIDQVVSIMTEALTAEDAYAAFQQCLFAIGEMQAADRGVWQALASTEDAALLTKRRDRIAPVAAELVARAKATGRLRNDFSETDVPVIIWAIGAINSHIGAAQPQLWRRYLQVVLDGFAADGETRGPLPVPALTRAQLVGARSKPRPAGGPQVRPKQPE
jgi:AcrR family transcriptional regulator